MRISFFPASYAILYFAQKEKHISVLTLPFTLILQSSHLLVGLQYTLVN